VKFTSGDHASYTILETPIVADVDNDDQVEIVLGHCNGNASIGAITVYGDADEDLAPGPEDLEPARLQHHERRGPGRHPVRRRQQLLQLQQLPLRRRRLAPPASSSTCAPRCSMCVRRSVSRAW
jgi:hypothetical protein